MYSLKTVGYTIVVKAISEFPCNFVYFNHCTMLVKPDLKCMPVSSNNYSDIQGKSIKGIKCVPTVLSPIYASVGTEASHPLDLGQWYIVISPPCGSGNHVPLYTRLRQLELAKYQP